MFGKSHTKIEEVESVSAFLVWLFFDEFSQVMSEIEDRIERVTA
jgi:hypothetical protein